RLLVLDGPSVRTPHLDSSADPANSRPDKISGKNRTTFPEPPASITAFGLSCATGGLGACPIAGLLLVFMSSGSCAAIPVRA
ncbi:MAG: hypothetical protein AB7N70_39300, partial [Dehalococcoidia bacterium]